MNKQKDNRDQKLFKSKSNQMNREKKRQKNK